MMSMENWLYTMAVISEWSKSLDMPPCGREKYCIWYQDKVFQELTTSDSSIWYLKEKGADFLILRLEHVNVLTFNWQGNGNGFLANEAILPERYHRLPGLSFVALVPQRYRRFVNFQEVLKVKILYFRSCTKKPLLEQSCLLLQQIIFVESSLAKICPTEFVNMLLPASRSLL